jgi:diacylglycerol kinase (ATP)
MHPSIRYIVNPIAGQGAGKLIYPQIEHMMHEHSAVAEIISTQYPGHAIELSRKAATQNYEAVIAVGGDGTSNEVLNGLMQAYAQGYKTTKMGIIGIGRGNDFAFGHGIPVGLTQGFEVIMQGKSRSADVGLIRGGDYPEGRYFGNGIGIGFDAVVGFEALKLTHLHGFMNYIVAAMRTIFLFYNAPLVRIEYDDQVITQASLMISIMNGRRMGGGFMMAPDAETDDGLLDFCIAGQMSRLRIMMMIPRFIKGTQAKSPLIKTGRANKIKVLALEGTLPTHADGETICTAGNELEVEIIKQPIKILTRNAWS